MSSPVRTRPVEDSIPKINNELAVGEDLEFQRRWWKFEHVVWATFTVIVLLDVLGVFGHGPLSKAHANSPHQSMFVEYERVARFETPSIITVHFSPATVHDGKIQLWVSDSLISSLGHQRISPQPETSVISQGGVLYTWPATIPPNSAAFAIEPPKPGIKQFVLRLPAAEDQLTERVLVMP